MTTTTEIDDVLAEYGGSLGGFDAERSAALWGTPGTILTDDFAGSLGTREAMAEALSQGYPFYRSLGLARVGHTLLEHVDLTPRITRVRVRWHFHASDGSHLTDGDDEYLLRRDDDGQHVYVAVAIDEQEKLAELAERLGISPA